MTDNMKWKNALLSSGMPLELEAAKILTTNGFTVHSNYKYDQGDSRFVKDISVDLHAKAYPPFSDSDGITAQVELLVECRQRHSDATWLFLPDLNKPDFSPVTLGNTLRVIDKFSSYVIESDAAVAFDADMPICQKGLEIDMVKGDADESAFRHGLSQLQYALPRLLTENVLSYIEVQPDKNIPFLFCPVFLTNSQLFVLNKDTTSEQIQACSEIREIATESPCLVMYLDYTRDFEFQCISEVSRLKGLQRSDKAMVIERKKASYYETRFNLPFTIIESLITADRYYLNAFFTQFIICTSHYFPTLVNTIKKTAESALETRKLIK
ncbi:hypothetical protein [Desulfonema magnum]|uniref:Uncharacterized protein n=1 Tax=Desulfonema magnum TaxID=45655 RepID=A0A975BIH9_9BACT|nr:hypothetical protein [Desulfonema magnum]QTA86329.1 Uncharacterized protein dnm_023510 [Desulfonema magnum]